MTKHRIDLSKEIHKCAWCGYPGATHEGGYQKVNGEPVSEWFCNREHFELWLRWKSAFLNHKAQEHIVPFAEVSG